MSTIQADLKSKIKTALDNAESYNLTEGITPEQGKEKIATELADCITTWLKALKIVLPQGAVQVQGSSTSQTNIAPLNIPLSTLQ